MVVGKDCCKDNEFASHRQEIPRKTARHSPFLAFIKTIHPLHFYQPTQKTQHNGTL
jgi:hypothetical protein